ncbi:MAG: DUF882 domain-containing protein [Gammaproteobacteria bacterium]|nr:DUF882 domain-containing protein [Gammaproteobacteria bacterium]MDH5311104.1 DUF882 domain-containing protein [Gammaproteobacteria bacterium]
MKGRSRLVPGLVASTLALAAILAPAGGTIASDARKLSFYHTHTGKSLEVVYAENGEYLPGALQQINNFLSDFRTGDIVRIDPGLLDLIWDVREGLDGDATYEVISAYRSPQTNEMLRGRSSASGVAKNSQHTHGKAIDVRLEGVDTRSLRDQALALRRGGVGYYQSSDFVHMDTGRVRSW